MLSSTSVPISPPVTPKAFSKHPLHIIEEHDSDQEELHLPPSALTTNTTPPPTDLRRKSNARRYSKAMATADKDAITFRDPFAVEGNFYLIQPTNRSKSTPQRSPSAYTRGSFTMDVFSMNGVTNGISELSRKRRNGNMEERMTEPLVTQGQATAFNTSSILNIERHVKKAKTDAAAAYDNVDITISDEEAFEDPDWIPDMDAFDNHPTVRVVWKGKKRQFFPLF
jgi:hypothetical protein